MKIIRIETCRECPHIITVLGEKYHWCEELHEYFDDPLSILPNCPLEDMEVKG